MEIKALTKYQVGKNDLMCVTTHDNTDDTISFHCSYFNIEMSAEQAGQIGAELTAASMVVEGREESDGDA